MKNPYNYLIEHTGEQFTYKEMCELISEKEEVNQKRTTQKLFWQNYMDLTFPRGMVKINKIYNSEEMLLIERKAKFTEYISDLIICYLATCNKSSPIVTYRELSEYLCMINKNFHEVKYNKFPYINKNINATKHTLSDDIDYDYKKLLLELNKFFITSDKIIKEIIRNSLKSLKSQSLIIYSETFKLYKTVYDNDLGKDIVQSFDCTEQQTKVFLSIRNKLLDEMNIKKLQNILFLSKQKRDEYFCELSHRMSESEELNFCTRYANAFKIEFGDESINYKYNKIIEHNKLLLNNNMQFKLLTTEELNKMDNKFKHKFVSDFIEVNGDF